MNPSSIAVSALRIKGKMQRKGYTVSTLAKETGLSPSTISRLCNSHIDTTRYTTLQKIAAVLKTKTEELSGLLSRKELKEIFGNDNIPF